MVEEQQEEATVLSCKLRQTAIKISVDFAMGHISLKQTVDFKTALDLRWDHKMLILHLTTRYHGHQT